MPRMPDYTAQVGLDIGRTPSADAGGEAVGQGLQNLGAGISELGSGALAIGRRYEEMQKQKAEYNTGLSFQQFNEQQSNKHDELVRNQQPGADGLYQQGVATFDGDANAWLKTLPKNLQEEYAPKIAVLREKYHGIYADAESSGRKSWELATNQQSLVTAQNQAAANPGNADAIIQDANSQIDKMTVPPAQKLLLKNDAARFILRSAFDAQHGNDVSGAAKTLGVRDPTTTGGAGPRLANGGENNTLLAALAKGESGGDYNKVFADGKWGTGGKPVTQMTLNEAIDTATAIRKAPGNPHNAGPLGKYQFVGSTLASLKNQLHLTGNEVMTPALQDRLAWANALNTGGDPSKLRAQWTSWAGKSDAEIRRLWDAGLREHQAFVASGGTQDTITGPTGGPAAATAHPGPAGTANPVGDQAAPAPAVLTPADPRFNIFTPEERQTMFNQVQSNARQSQALARGELEPRVQDASAALMTTGRYDGQMPTQQDFTNAYGAQEGSQRYALFRQTQQVGQEIDGFKSMTPEQIQADVEAARPVGAGDGFAMAQSRYEAVQKAAATTLAMRKADPAKYVTTVNPGIAAQWQNANTPDGYRTALSSMAAAQTQLGIAPQDQKLLPDDFASRTVDAYKNVDSPLSQRVAAITGTVLRTPDPVQQRAVFQQLVKAGLPATTEGAIEAYARGDIGAGERLMTAATTDFSKLPAASEDKIKKADLDDAIAKQVMAPDQIGGIAYGVRYGGPENIARAQNGADLMQRAVRMRMAQGETSITNAVDAVAKDMFGTGNEVFNYTINGMNMAAALPTGYDKGVLYRGVSAIRPQLESAITQSVQAEAARISAGEPTKQAVTEASIKNQVNNIISGGEITNYGQSGFAFIDPYTNKAIPGPDGKPFVFTLDDIQKAGNPYPTSDQPQAAPQQVAPSAPTAASTASPAAGSIPNVKLPTPPPTSNVPTSGSDAFNKAKQQFTPEDAGAASSIYPGGL